MGEDGRYEEERVRNYALSTFDPYSSYHEAILDGSPGSQTESTRGELARHSSFKKLSEVDLDKLWDSLVERYSRCNLTYSSDKLPALSGLAQAFSIIRGPGFSLDGHFYLAGIWRPDLPKALCWTSEYYGGRLQNYGGEHRNYRPHSYRAPSWSWASIEGPVAARNLSGNPACCVVDVKVFHEDERYKAGAVKGGILYLRSRVIGPFTYDPSSGPGLTTSPSLDSRVREAIDAPQKWWFSYWDERDGVSGKDSISYLDPLPQAVNKDGIVKDTGAVRKSVRLEALTEEPRIRLFIVPIVFHKHRNACGLILCQVVNNPELKGFDEGLVFQRVGYFDNLWIEKVLDLVPETTIAII